MAIYGVYAGTDSRTYCVELTLTSSAEALNGAAVTNLGFHSMAIDKVGWSSDLHVAKDHGGIQIILGGGIEIGVTAGDMRTIRAGAGDAVVFVDTHGDGHSSREAGAPLMAITIRLDGNTDSMKAAFTGWPDDVAFNAP